MFRHTAVLFMNALNRADVRRSSEYLTKVNLGAGALDLHFSPHDPYELGVALSDGTLARCRLDLSIEMIASVNQSCLITPPHISRCSFGDDAILTSFFWHPQWKDKVCITTTSGRVILGTLPSMHLQDLAICDSSELYSHSEAAWTCAITPQDFLGSNQRLLSGGDDSALRLRILMNNETGPIATGLAQANTRLHSAGVTAIFPLCSDDLPFDDPETQYLVTGGYDDYVRLVSFAKNSTTFKPLIVAELNLGGGVWKIRQLQHPHSATHYTSIAVHDNPVNSILLVASCMYAGACIVQLRLPSPAQTEEPSKSEPEFTILGWFKEHDSMCYAAEVQPLENLSPQPSWTIVSCSFYDRRLCLWKWQGD